MGIAPNISSILQQQGGGDNGSGIVITSTSPTTLKTSGYTVVEVYGSGFTAGSVMWVGLSSYPVTFVDATHLTWTNGYGGDQPGTAQLQVSNPPHDDAAKSAPFPITVTAG